MKKICSVFIAALLAVMLCVPAFATCSHVFVPSEDDDVNHYCTECGLVSNCIWDMGYCEVCGQSSLFNFFCSHMRDSEMIVLYSADEHYFYCSFCDLLVPLSPIFATASKHTNSCSFCTDFGVTFPVGMLSAFDCENLMPFMTGEGADLNPDVLGYFYDSNDHYFSCLDCGAFIPSYFVFGECFPHSDECSACYELAAGGLSFFDPNSTPATPAQGILSSVSTIVTSAIEWLSAFVLCIVSNPLLLVFVVCVFVGLGIGLVKRIIRL